MTESDVKRFWEKVEVGEDDECWIWVGSTKSSGYGEFWYDGRTHIASRIAYLIEHGEKVPADKQACHSCDNPSCVNPEHIWVGSMKDNLEDARNKGRMSVGSNHYNAKLDEGQVAEIKDRYANGELQKDIAEDYEVEQQRISKIVRGDIWKHV